MKRVLDLCMTVVMVMCSFAAKAQIVNNDFEDWGIDTTRFAGYAPYLAPENFSYNDPKEWTTSNSITGMTALGGYHFVTQSNDAQHGSNAIRIITDTIARVLTNQLTVPGFAINGFFTADLNSLIGGLNITPMSLAGAGQPFMQRLTRLKGYYKYAPVFNPNTNANDTCLIWATLRKGKTAVADAIFKTTASSNGTYQFFDVAFEYHNCLQPDTLVILLSSSIPKTAGLVGGQSNLVRGSSLLVDSIYYDVTGAGYNFTPIARNDRDTTIKNTQKSINVLANDEDCDDPNLSVSILINAKNGNATVQSNQIVYTPANNFLGYDSIYYQASDGTNNSAAWVKILVRAATGISEVNLMPVRLFPNPTNQQLYIQLDVEQGMKVEVFDAIGNSMGVYPLNSPRNTISVLNYPAGVYVVQVADADNQMVSRGRFVVSR